MTMAALTDYRDEDRPNHSVRFRNDTWHVLQAHAREDSTDVTTLVNASAEAVELGIARCARCGHPVPVVLGDTTGMTLREAVAGALHAAAGQKCRAHEPVRIGAQPPPGVIPFRPPPAEFPVPARTAKSSRM